MNIKSDKIRVYPTSKRSDEHDRQGRINTEKNLINIINRLTGQKSFIIDGLTINNSTDKITAGQCNIGGYLIEITDDIDISGFNGSKNTLYFKITKTTTDGFEELVGIDDEGTGNYTGLEVKQDNNIIITDTILPIAKYINGDWVAIETADLVYNINQIQVDENTLGSTKDQSLENFLQNDFIIDAGEL